ncbi:hypothetical protein [Micromonospora sp. CB01531]|uniref:hypothetical protein n=1 Tax=Micromonospora sp. CB01531 TaxID=1718947 RepID=UPI00093C5AEC|nr:hypothetical protein [Micromonospora sp. CB01531]OKI47206.1 hypothetical protein A6A27_10165 [Micromonospora sp. CB01531]
MATPTCLDTICTCGCAKACHRAALRWGQKTWEKCRHCDDCQEFTSGPARRRPPEPEVLDRQERWACRACGARYGKPYGDHECGPLTPVTVTIAVRTPEVAR